MCMCIMCNKVHLPLMYSVCSIYDTDIVHYSDFPMKFVRELWLLDVLVTAADIVHACKWES